MKVIGFIIVAISWSIVSSQEPTTPVPDVTIVQIVTVKADAKVEVEEFQFVPPTAPQEEPIEDEGEGEMENDDEDPFSGDDDFGEGDDFGDETDPTTPSSQPGINDKTSTSAVNDVDTDIGGAVIGESVGTTPKIENIDLNPNNSSTILNIENEAQPKNLGDSVGESFVTTTTNDVIADVTTDPLSFGEDLNDDTTTPQSSPSGSEVTETLVPISLNALGGIVGITQTPSSFNNLGTTVIAPIGELNPTTNLIVVGASGAESIGAKTDIMGVEPAALSGVAESRSADQLGEASPIYAGGGAAGGTGFANNNNNNNGDNNVNNNGNNDGNNGFANNNNNNNGNRNVNNNGQTNAGGNNNNNNNGFGNINNNGGGYNNYNNNNNNNNNGNFDGSSANNNNNNNNNG